jgi:murein DD-endopeptidase MepM/ murein hydrolase activator NlpD
MNPQAIKIIVGAFSMKKELKILFYSIAIIFILPVFAVLILTQAGIDIVSGALVTNNQQTMEVDIHDPANGRVVDHISATGVWPVSGPVSLEFGQNDLPYQPFHTGIDIASPVHAVGDPVVAFMAGTVTYADTTRYGFGKHVQIYHGHHVSSIYGHLDTIGVVEGQEVTVGTILGTRGTTGWSTGPHLHFQINVFNIPVNPRVFLSGNP